MSSTPSEAVAAALADIRYNIGLAQDFISGLTLERFEQDLRTFYAVVRCLEIISEASRRLPAELKSRHPSIPWQQIAGAGNVYRHDYEEVAHALVWHTIRTALPVLLAAVEAELGPRT